MLTVSYKMYQNFLWNKRMNKNNIMYRQKKFVCFKSLFVSWSWSFCHGIAHQLFDVPLVWVSHYFWDRLASCWSFLCLRGRMPELFHLHLSCSDPKFSLRVYPLQYMWVLFFSPYRISCLLSTVTLHRVAPLSAKFFS